MSDQPSVSELHAALAEAAREHDVIQRTLEVVAIIDAVAAPFGIRPVVVGGMAVYFWTARDEFLTYDIDVVMDVPGELDARLAELGFARLVDGRHWRLADTDVLVEAPSAQLDRDATIVEVELASGRTARMLSRVDVLINRLDEFQATGHQIVGQQIPVLLAGLTNEEAADLDARAPLHRVSVILKAMRQLANDLTTGRQPPQSDELHAIARKALRAEYSP